MICCLILSFIIYITYIIYIKIKYNPECISESYYLLKNGNIFTIWIILVALTIFPVWVEISSEDFQFLSFISALALISVGLFPRYLEEDRKYHISGACITCIVSIIWNILSKTIFIPCILLIIATLLFILKVNKKLFWIECLAFINIYLSNLSLIL